MLKTIFFLCIISFNAFAASHKPQEFLDSIKDSKDQSKQIVTHYCAMCHDKNPQIPVGAPRIGVESDWVNRLKQDKSLLWQHTNEGYGLMPARGGCFECSDHQLLSAIDWMLDYH